MGAMLVHDMRLSGGTPTNLAQNNYVYEYNLRKL
jgi:hypothetical protein